MLETFQRREAKSVKYLKNETYEGEKMMAQVRIRISSICLLFTIDRDL